MNPRIAEIERKFLDPNLRTRGEHPAKALTAEERKTYAKFLEAKGDLKGSASFRNYKEEKWSK